MKLGLGIGLTQLRGLIARVLPLIGGDSAITADSTTYTADRN